MIIQKSYTQRTHTRSQIVEYISDIHKCPTKSLPGCSRQLPPDGELEDVPVISRSAWRTMLLTYRAERHAASFCGQLSNTSAFQ